MKIIAFIEAHRGDVIRRTRRHCGPWQDAPPRGLPRKTCPSRAVRPMPEVNGGIALEVDRDVPEHACREAREQPELPPERRKASPDCRIPPCPRRDRV